VWVHNNKSGPGLGVGWGKPPFFPGRGQNGSKKPHAVSPAENFLAVTFAEKCTHGGGETPKFRLVARRECVKVGGKGETGGGGGGRELENEGRILLFPGGGTALFQDGHGSRPQERK